MKIPYTPKPLQNFRYKLLLLVALTGLASAFANSAAIATTAKHDASAQGPGAGDNSAVSTAIKSPTRTKAMENGLIAFTSGRGDGIAGTRDIYLMNPDGTGKKNITYDAREDSEPVWSPDGTKIAYLSKGDFDGGIAVMDADGGNKKLITNNFSDASPTWSPDGRRIAFSGIRDDGIFSIYVVNSSDGSGLTKLSEGTNPSWSPDGTKIAFNYSYQGLTIMNADGSGLTFPSLPAPLYGAVQFDWSPDSKKLVFSGTNYETFEDSIYTANLDGTDLVRIENTTGAMFGGQFPSWSPDGTKITFSSYPTTGGLGADVFVVNLDGTGLTKLTSDTKEDFAPDWQLKQAGATPLPETYTISGRVNYVPGRYFDSPVTLSGTLARSTIIDFEGNYSFDGLQAGGNYTVSLSSTSFSFEPSSYVFNNLGANQPDKDFVATYIPINITGHITDTTGAPIPNVEVSSGGDYPLAPTRTDANGYYSFLDVPRRRIYIIHANPFGAYTYAPELHSFYGLNESVVADFVGTKQPSHTISGRVTDSSPTGVGVQGVPIELARDGGFVTLVLTDANGYYTFGERQDGYNYNVYTHPTGTHAYIPNSLEFLNLQSDQTANFVRRPVTGYQQISGQILDQHKNPVGEVFVTLSGAYNLTTLTDPDGRYTIYNMPAGAGFNYTVTPSKSGYNFNPGQRSFTLRGDQTANFAAIQTSR
ncbi:MAG TPA: carboxypeptidase regulatory-like domain-containing protein [Pyrinomonadaceae bacterium]|jgi:hypothetical protein|nr:carboxypeptidase regulatory-like domain-containing protein [Pyrinomonadaceae bacterium]